MGVAYVLDEVFAGHCPPSAHPERPERFHAVRDALAAAGLGDRGVRVPARAATMGELGRVHTAAYLSELEREVPGKTGWLDSDTYFSPGSWDAALAAAGAAVDLTLGVLDGQHRRGLAIVRPPGHHAEADRAMGFCLLNNVAVAAAAARDAGAARVAVVDLDVHHGNGTQHIFESDPTVMYLSCHQYPFYPGTGAPSETGLGEATGTIVNVGLPAGCNDDDYQSVIERVFAPSLRGFQPDIVLLSAGFDAHLSDPLAAMKVTRDGYGRMAQAIVSAVDEIAEGRLVALLEGGYHLDGLAGGVVELFDAMDRPTAPRPTPSLEPGTGAARAIAATLAAHPELSQEVVS